VIDFEVGIAIICALHTDAMREQAGSFIQKEDEIQFFRTREYLFEVLLRFSDVLVH
jgi:hypothetical protein